ncbi:mycofactocin system GMC family oxidoreductase MftG [Gordonia hankookensis]|uniref:Mycofactocin system GMC family oxidoreductase MftG n=1 Tax=Gordonia hankookensis TaxID=589403 RepID=A0ABR7W7N0_9ACTN|nr:mycofactocin system GMC family oxidoreductase MftG [Gordonia hankookensis]MBD1318830.1 mycofactocin system GMC family oxidoreductase MftG [Gordonia hankookensis]
MTLGDLPATADVVIVGAGSAGCVVAERLSRDPDRTVLLIERGSSQWPTEAVRDLRGLPIGFGSPYAVSHEEPSGLAVVRGRGLGGSSSVNGGYFMRWHADDFVDWPSGWRIDEIGASYAELDGRGGTMSVSPFADDELAEVTTRFESYWSDIVPVRPPADAWPIVGLNRVRSNRDGMVRRTAAEAYLRGALDRPNLTIGADAEVDALRWSGAEVTGVVVGDTVVGAGEVILCAGAIGTAVILLRSGLAGGADPDVLAVREHREVLVHYRSRVDGPPTALLQSVVHTVDDLEIRCYSSDMARYIEGLPPVGPAIGVAVMRPGTRGTVRIVGGAPIVDLGVVDVAEAARLERGVAAVTEMLRSAAFADIVESGSVAVDPVVRTSQHAWGSMPMGTLTDGLGGVAGVRGLRIVDGSILPTAGRSGPHATVMMLASRIAAVLADR